MDFIFCLYIETVTGFYEHCNEPYGYGNSLCTYHEYICGSSLVTYVSKVKVETLQTRYWKKVFIEWYS